MLLPPTEQIRPSPLPDKHAGNIDLSTTATNDKHEAWNLLPGKMPPLISPETRVLASLPPATRAVPRVDNGTRRSA